jgi:hypothetical protein
VSRNLSRQPGRFGVHSVNTHSDNSVTIHFRTHVIIPFFFFSSLYMRNPFLKFCHWVLLTLYNQAYSWSYTLQPWRRRQNLSLKLQYLPKKLRGVTPKRPQSLVTMVITTKLIYYLYLGQWKLLHTLRILTGNPRFLICHTVSKRLKKFTVLHFLI